MNNLKPMSLLTIGYPVFRFPEKEIKIKAEVAFGRPSSKDCPGHGICRVELTTAPIPSKNTNCTSSFAFIQQNKDKEICFYFLNSSLCIKARKKYFRKEFFKVHEPFVLPYGISQSFGMFQNFIIESGQYAIRKTAKYYIVTFSTK